MKTINMICLPHAGGSSVAFQGWVQYLPDWIKLVPVELAGRGRRISEPLYQSIGDGVEDLFVHHRNLFEQGNYIIFGHSMGAVMGFELLLRIRAEALPLPTHLFVSGKEAPHIKRPEEKMVHRYSEKKFKEELMTLGGTDHDFFQNEALLELLLPVLKNDFFITETYYYREPADPFDVDISMFVGKDDDLDSADLFEWIRYTSGNYHLHYFDGDHFFIHKRTEEIIDHMVSVLMRKYDHGIPHITERKRRDETFML